MPAKNLGCIINGLKDISVHNFKNRKIEGITCDSREVKPRFIFVATSGTKLDGHKHIPEAIKNGCSVVVCEKKIYPRNNGDITEIFAQDTRKILAEMSSNFYDRPSEKLSIIGITGTNGKTTTAFLIKSILEDAGKKVGLLGTIQYQMPDKIITAPMTTPPADKLQKYLHQMVCKNVEIVVMEVSSHSLKQKRVYGIDFSVGVFTNLTQDHLDYHITLEDYRTSKSILFETLRSRSFAILNEDDTTSKILAIKTKAQISRYGLKNVANCCATAKIKSEDYNNTNIIISLDTHTVEINSKLIGTHNIYNILAASLCCYKMGYSLDNIKKGIEAVKSLPGRLEKIGCGQNFNVIVDFAHTEDALRNILVCLRRLTKGRLILVFGCGGDRDKDKRPKMGKVAQEFADFFIITSDNPRSENPIRIIKDIEIGISKKNKYVAEEDRFNAIKLALSMAKKGDTVVIAGKGHEKYQILKDKIIPFDDREIVKHIFYNLAKK